jgi:alpha-L-arabinofuranosidase
VQDILDLIEYANGSADSTWGAKRAAAGHPQPFDLKYLGIGNEDAMTPEFGERFKMLFDSVRTKHPEVTIIGTAGPSPSGRDFDQGWKLARELSVPIVDEHYYMQPEWFLGNTKRYDNYERDKTKVYLGEYASRGNTARNALAEAIYMTSLERNGDVVHMASYAPLLCKLGHVQWYPDMIYFSNTQVFPTTNYYVQQMFGANQGDAYVKSNLKLMREPGEGQAIAMSSVRDSATGDLIIKLVNLSASSIHSAIEIAGGDKINPEADCMVLSGDEKLTNYGDPRAKGNVSDAAIKPVVSKLKVSKAFDYNAPAYSLTVLRLKTK